MPNYGKRSSPSSKSSRHTEPMKQGPARFDENDPPAKCPECGTSYGVAGCEDQFHAPSGEQGREQS
jgi:hypothetical protein